MTAASRVAGVPEARQHPVLKRYRLRRRRIPVGGRVLSIVAPDERAWLREGTAVDRALSAPDWEPPYWTRVWPSAVALARQLAGTALGGLRVIDLGCGIGVPGIQAAALGAAVTFADRARDCLAFAEWNAAHQPGCVVTPEVRELDWSDEAVPGPFDLMLLSDVSYHRSHHPAVLRQVSTALDSGGCVVHTDPMRELSTVFLRELGRRFSVTSWTCRTVVDRYRGGVRVALASRSDESLAAWRERLGRRTAARARASA